MSETTGVLDREERALTEFQAAVGAVPIIRRGVAGVVEGWAPHDVLWHVTYWVGKASEVLELAREGPPFPEEPEEASYYDAQNEAVFASGREMTWAELIDRLATNRRLMRAALEAAPEAARRWMEERAMEEVEHYRLHAAQVRVFATGA